MFLVHGLDDTVALFESLRPWLESKAWTVYCHNLIPNDGTAGLEELAEQLARHVEAALGPEQPIDIVGFSMGGLVSRYYVQRLARSRCIRRLITISSPHQGTWTAYLRNNSGARQMRPGSQFLQQLNRDVHSLKTIAFTSIWTPLDLMIVPAESSVVVGAASVPVWVAGHALMLRDRRVLQLVANALLT